MTGADAAFALLLGAVAAFNPCGFALLPAYVAVIVTGSADAGISRATSLRRALGFGTAMTLGFVAIFAGFGLLFGAVNAALQGSVLPYLPYLTAVLGVALVVLGIVMVRHGELRGPGLSFAGKAPQRTFASQILYGVTFGLASMSCTIGPFLAVVTMSLAAGSPVGAVMPFFVYALGMGTAVVAVSLIAAVAGASAAGALRRHSRRIVRVGGVVMILAGLYVALFGLAEVLPQYGVHVLDPVLLTTARWQGSVVTAIQSWGTTVLIVAACVVAVASIAVLIASRRKDPAKEPTPRITPL